MQVQALIGRTRSNFAVFIQACRFATSRLHSICGGVEARNTPIRNSTCRIHSHKESCISSHPLKNRWSTPKDQIIQYLWGSSHLAGQVQRSNPKLLSRGEGRSPLKYIIFLSDFEYFIEKKFSLLTRVWVSIPKGPKLLPRGQTLSAKSVKK